MFNTFRSPLQRSSDAASAGGQRNARAPLALRLAAIALSFTLVFGVHTALAERAMLILA